MTDADVIGLPDRSAERYVDAAELAKLMGVSTRTVARWVQQGIPSEDWGIKARRFRPSLAIAWARSRDRSAA